MCETLSWRLELRPLPLHPTSTYTCGVIIAPKVCDGGKLQLNKKREITFYFTFLFYFKRREIILFYFKRREKLFKFQFLILYLRFCLPLHVYFGNFDFCICVVGDFFLIKKKNKILCY